MRNYLYTLAQILAFPLCLNDVLVNPTCCDVVVLGHGSVDKALVVADVHVALASVVGDKHLAMRNRVHSASVIIDVRVYLDAGNLVAGKLQQFCS